MISWYFHKKIKVTWVECYLSWPDPKAFYSKNLCFQTSHWLLRINNWSDQKFFLILIDNFLIYFFHNNCKKLLFFLTFVLHLLLRNNYSWKMFNHSIRPTTCDDILQNIKTVLTSIAMLLANRYLGYVIWQWSKRLLQIIQIEIKHEYLRSHALLTFWILHPQILT